MPHDVAMAVFQQQIESWIAEKVINPWCGICNSRVWTYEQRRTKFATIEEAKPELAKLEMEQLSTRMQIEERKAAKN